MANGDDRKKKLRDTAERAYDKVNQSRVFSGPTAGVFRSMGYDDAPADAPTVMDYGRDYVTRKLTGRGYLDRSRSDYARNPRRSSSTRK